MNKLSFITFVIACSSAVAFSGALKDFVDDVIYSTIQKALVKTYPNEPIKTNCMIADFRKNKIAEKFYSADLFVEQDQLINDLRPFVDDANFKCTLIQFFKSSLGISVSIALLVLAIGLIYWLIRRRQEVKKVVIRHQM